MYPCSELVETNGVAEGLATGLQCERLTCISLDRTYIVVSICIYIKYRHYWTDQGYINPGTDGVAEGFAAGLQCERLTCPGKNICSVNFQRSRRH